MTENEKQDLRGCTKSKAGIEAVTQNLNKMAGFKHGGYSKALQGGNLDKRTSIGKAMVTLRANLETDLGGIETISTQQKILIDRIVQKVFQAQAFESAIAAGALEPKAFYLALTNSLRLDLLALGLNKKLKSINSLKEIIENETHNQPA